MGSAMREGPGFPGVWEWFRELQEGDVERQAKSLLVGVTMDANGSRMVTQSSSGLKLQSQNTGESQVWRQTSKQEIIHTH